MGPSHKVPAAMSEIGSERSVMVMGCCHPRGRLCAVYARVDSQRPTKPIRRSDARQCSHRPGGLAARVFSRDRNVPLGQTLWTQDLRTHAGVFGAVKALAANQGLYNGFLAA